ncbi:hypothetical protein RRG08_062713 [Elysia crispata]|uniref:Uncharacterized protein n=1 Tax=Elysia crispata TaxID=231223 RepID=A0AAE1AC95_9GAST|nr:hypothetical protein RRG08_062713 [Elysia crispata]
MNSRIPPSIPLPSDQASTSLTVSQKSAPSSSPQTYSSASYRPLHSPTKSVSLESGPKFPYDPSTAPYVPSSHVTSSFSHPATSYSTNPTPAAGPASPPSGPSTSGKGGKPERAGQERQPACESTRESEVKGAADKFGYGKDTSTPPLGKTHAGK